MAENQVAYTEYITAEQPAGDPQAHRAWMVAAFLLGAIACDTLGSPEAVGRAVEHALDMPEADKMLFPLLVVPAQDRQGSEPVRLFEPLTEGENRVLRYLPSNLSAREIADELYVSMNTVKTHQRHLYRKLDARTRSEAVERARVLGLLAPPVPHIRYGHARGLRR